ncbi:AP2-interacting clathrin-endocytosis protein-like [Scyliorhinus canicula]|uniref:AP2-interacting clathrin-endocytosis protein-like n=1 Tax=Scyliorhinus canicula TaxID=7830 RepID=UPI0018F70E15|nr:AP2-interacting clathrin-endocytosis protein-like [Scyliorhinus canicula]
MYLNTLNADQVHVGGSINGEMELNNVNVQPRDLPQSSSPSSSLNGARVGCVSVINDGNVIPVPMAESQVDLKEPTLGSCLESSPETDCNISKVKLTMYQYSEEADTEDSPNELCPEPLQSPEDKPVPEPKSLPATCKMEDSVGNRPSEDKPGISPEDSPEDQGVSKSSTLSGHDLAGKNSSSTSTPEELKDYDSSSGVESKSDEKPESANLFIYRTELSPQDDLLDQDLGIHLERGDEDPETLAADDLHGDPPTEPMVSSEDEEHSEEDCPGVNKPIQCGLEGIDNPVFEDKTTSDSNLEVQTQCVVKPSTLHALDENEELVPTKTPLSLEHGYTAPDSLAPQRCLLSGAGFSEDPTCDQTLVFGLQPCEPPVSVSTPCPHLPPTKSSTDSVPGVTLSLHHVPGVDWLCGNFINLQRLNDPPIDANGGHMQQQNYSACEKNGSTGLLSEGDQTPQTPACVPWTAPLLPPILSTIYEVETAEETRLEDVEREEAGNPAADWQCLELIDDPGEKVLHLQIEPVQVVQQLINQTLLLSGDGVKLQSKVMVDQAELSKWTDLISPLDDSTASVTSVTSYSPEDISSSQGEWTVVELETHH